jgi:hypothetical protein
MRATVFRAATLILTATAAHPEEPSFTAGALLQTCQRHDGSAFDTICQAYISGYFAGLSAGNVLSRTGTKICIPMTLGPGDVRPVIETYLAAHPDLAGRDAATAVAAALFSSLPVQAGAGAELG